MKGETNTPTPSSTRPFLSGESDPELLASRQRKLRSMFDDLSLQNDPRATNNNSSSGKIDDTFSDSKKSGASFSLIEVLEDAPNVDKEAIGHEVDTPSASSLSGKEQLCRDKSEEDGLEDSPPPPLSLMDAVAEATTCTNNAVLPTGKESVVCTNPTPASTGWDNPEPPSLMESMMTEAEKARSEKNRKIEEKERKRANASSFGSGLKKGFLSSSRKSSKALKQSDEVKKKRRENTGGTKTGSGFKKGFLGAPQKEKRSSHENNDKSSCRLPKEDDVFELDSNGNLLKASNIKAEDIPTIRPKQNNLSSSKMNSLREEVQEAMRNNPLERLNSDEWATPDLMQRIAQNPRLAAGLANPKFTAALEALRENPRHVMNKFKDHPEIIDLLNEFSGVMGDHFTKLGAEEEEDVKKIYEKDNLGPLAEEAIQKQAERKALGREAWDASLSGDEKDKIDSVVGNKELTQLLMDTDLQRVIKECSIPGRMQMYLKHDDYGPKLRRLMDAGLLQIAR